MHEGKVAVLGARAPTGVELVIQGGDPALRAKEVGVRAPDLGVFVRASEGEDELGALGNVLADQRGVQSGFAECERDGGPVSQDLVDEGVEEHHVVDLLAGDAPIVRDAGEPLPDLGPEAGLPLRIDAHHVDGPRDAGRDGLVTRGKERHHLVDGLLVVDLPTPQEHAY